MGTCSSSQVAAMPRDEDIVVAITGSSGTGKTSVAHSFLQADGSDTNQPLRSQPLRPRVHPAGPLTRSLLLCDKLVDVHLIEVADGETLPAVDAVLHCVDGTAEAPLAGLYQALNRVHHDTSPCSIDFSEAVAATSSSRNNAGLAGTPAFGDFGSAATATSASYRSNRVSKLGASSSSASGSTRWASSSTSRAASAGACGAGAGAGSGSGSSKLSIRSMSSAGVRRYVSHTGSSQPELPDVMSAVFGKAETQDVHFAQLRATLDIDTSTKCYGPGILMGVAVTKVDDMNPTAIARLRSAGRHWGTINRCSVTLTSAQTGYGCTEAFVDLIRQVARVRMTEEAAIRKAAAKAAAQAAAATAAAAAAGSYAQQHLQPAPKLQTSAANNEGAAAADLRKPAQARCNSMSTATGCRPGAMTIQHTTNTVVVA